LCRALAPPASPQIAKAQPVPCAPCPERIRATMVAPRLGLLAPFDEGEERLPMAWVRHARTARKREQAASERPVALAISDV
jgi:hypothetical protein